MIATETFSQFAEILIEQTKKRSLRWECQLFDPVHFEVFDKKGVVIQTAILKAEDEIKTIRLAVSESISVKTGAQDLILEANVESEYFSYTYNYSIPSSSMEQSVRTKRQDQIFIELIDTVFIQVFTERVFKENAIIKKSVFLPVQYREYKSIPLMRLFSRLHTEKRYFTVHRCIWSSKTRREEFEKYIIKPTKKSY